MFERHRVPILHAIFLGIVQGLTEFLPLSSSGHLILVPELLGWDELPTDIKRAFDVSLHLGTLVAVVAYFRSDLARYACAGWRSLATRSIPDLDARVAWLLVVATIPAVIVGATFDTYIEDHLTGPVTVGVMLVVFGIVLGLADRLPSRRQMSSTRVTDGWSLGVAQSVALVPGTSRSGISISAGRALGFDRDTATRLAFLMLAPVTVAAAVYTGVELAVEGFPRDMVAPFAVGMITSAITGYAAIWWLLRFVRTRGFAPFVVYRLVVGLAVILWFGVR